MDWLEPSLVCYIYRWAILCKKFFDLLCCLSYSITSFYYILFFLPIHKDLHMVTWTLIYVEKMNFVMIWCLQCVGSMVFPLVMMRFKQKSRNHSMLIIRQLNHWYGIISCHTHTDSSYDWTYLCIHCLWYLVSCKLFAKSYTKLPKGLKVSTNCQHDTICRYN